MRSTRVLWSTLVATAAALFLAACADAGKVTAPSTGPGASADLVGPVIVAGQLTGPTTVSAATAAAEPGHMTICKAGTAGVFTIQIFAHVYQTDPATGAIVLNSAGFPIALSNPDGTPVLVPTPVFTNNSVTIAAGECVRFHAGQPFEFTVVATENASTTTVLSGITAFTTNTARVQAGQAPQACGTSTLEFCSINLAGRSVTLGELNQFHGGIATFTNAPVPPGFLKICKLTPAGVTLPANFPTSFSFTVTGVTGVSTVSVPTGQCVVVDGSIAAGTNVSVVEAAVANVTLTAITSIPATGAGSATGTLATRTATATIASNVTTEIRFTNAPTPGEITLCKVAGTGVTVGTQFLFDVTVNGVLSPEVLPLAAGAGPAGTCVNSGPLAAGTTLVIQERAVNGVTAAITSNPASGAGAASGNNTTRTATVTVAAGVSTVITFTNSIPALGCTLTQGYWKNHPNAWPVSSLMLGSVTYTKAQLLAILGTPVRGNGLISLSHQLIAAKLNIAKGASSATISTTISAADAMIGSLVVPPVGSGFLSTSSTSSLEAALDTYNNGLTRGGPPHCGD